MSRTRQIRFLPVDNRGTPAAGTPQVFLSSLADNGRELSMLLDIGPAVTVLLPGDTGQARLTGHDPRNVDVLSAWRCGGTDAQPYLLAGPLGWANFGSRGKAYHHAGTYRSTRQTPEPWDSPAKR